MKKNLLLLLLLTLGITSLFAQQTIEIRLSEEHPEQSERLDIRGRDNESNVNGNVIVKLINAGNQNASVSVTMENTDESNWLIFFSRSWTKKDLRKAHVIDKRFKDSNTEIVSCDGVTTDIFVSPSDEAVLTSLDIIRGEETDYKISFFIANKKRIFFNLCTKTILQRNCVVNLRITVEEKTDNELPKLQEEIDALYNVYQKAIKEHVFCVNPLHRRPSFPSFEERVNPYVIRKDSLKNRINCSRSQWEPNSNQYVNYQELIDKIETIRLDDAFLVDSLKDDCGKHVHKCVYCKYTLKQLRNLSDYYFSGTQTGKVTKEKGWTEAKKIYDCSRQPKRKKEDRAEDYRMIIEKNYKELTPTNKR